MMTQETTGFAGGCLSAVRRRQPEEELLEFSLLKEQLLVWGQIAPLTNREKQDSPGVRECWHKIQCTLDSNDPFLVIQITA